MFESYPHQKPDSGGASGALNEAMGDGKGLGLEVKVQGLGGPEH